MATSDPLAATEAASPASGNEDGSRPPIEVIAAGTRLGRYVIENLLGCGGMGSVYAARDPELRRSVAIKVLHPHLTDLQTRLRREGQAIAKLRHPNVVTIYDVGSHDDMLFIAMELVVGETLSAYLQNPRSWRDVVGKFVAAGRGLAAAHASALVHRDFKPDNVLLGKDGTVVVTDFGLVDSMQSTEVLDLSKLISDPVITQTGTFMGTPAYMAPEQFLGAPVDVRTDQFSFCVALWEGLYGARPFKGANIEELRGAVLSGKLPKPARRVPAFVRRALARGLSLDPAKRFASMTELLDTLERRPWHRSPVVLGGLGVAVAGATLAIWFAAHRHSAPAAFSLHVGPGRPIERSDRLLRADVTLLADGRLAHISPQGELAITSLNGASRRMIPLPIAGKALGTTPSGDTEMVVEIERESGGCAYWGMSVDGADGKELTTDADCASRVELSPDHTMLAIAHGDSLVVRDIGVDHPRWQSKRAVRSMVWSPDGRRLAVVDLGGTVVFDAASGTERARFQPMVSVVWHDNNRLLALRNAGFVRTELQLIDVASAHVQSIQILDGQCDGMSSDGKGILLARYDQTSQAYVLPTAGNAPIDLDAQSPLETESEMDFVTIGWTPSNEVITLSLRGDDRAIVRTPLHGRAKTLVSHHGPASGIGVFRSEALYSRNSDSEHCEVRAVDVTTGADRQVLQARCDDDRYITSCAEQAGRCLLVSRNALEWIDPKTGETTPAPGVTLRDVISPDASEAASASATQIVIRSLTGKPERRITLRPPMAIRDVQWAGGDRWLVSSGSTDEGVTTLALVAADGTWKPIVTSATHQLMFSELAMDESQIAVIGRTTNVTWQYFPIE